MIFPVFVFCLLPFCPESPRWLAAKGAPVEEVAEILALLEGNNTTSTTPSVASKAREIIAIAQHEAELDVSWREVSIVTFRGNRLHRHTDNS